MQAEKAVWAAGSNCLPDEVIFAFVHGELSADAEQGIEEHLNRCADCRSVVAETARFAFDPAVPDAASGTAPVDQATAGSELLAPGTRVSRYVIGGPIGVGAAGVVYAAQDPQLRRKIALKLMRPDQSQGPNVEALKARLLREARAMAQLSHPNVVAVYDVGTYEDQVFIVMELVEGETLDRWLIQEKRPWREIVRAFCDAGRGLAAAHAVQIVHRDFKPANVLVGSDRRVRVTDFGLAHPIDVEDAALPTSGDVKSISPNTGLATWTATDAGGMAGTPVFMAPEQFLRKRPVPRTDQFSFCVALYMALYGGHPFSVQGPANRTLLKLAEDVVAGRLLPAPVGTDVPPRLFDILSRGLAIDPDDRFASMEDLLDELMNDRAAPVPTRSALRRSPLIVASLGAAAIAIWAATRAPGAAAARAEPVVVDRADAAAIVAAPLVANDESAPESAAPGSVPAVRVRPPPSSVRPSPRVDRKVRAVPPKPARKRFEDGLKDPLL